MMHRTNISSAQAQHIRCIDCDDPMNAIYGSDAREICWACGGEIRHAVEREHIDPAGIALR